MLEVFEKKCPVVLFEDEFERMDKFSGIGFLTCKTCCGVARFPGNLVLHQLIPIYIPSNSFFLAATSTRLSCEVHFAAGR